MKEEIRDPIELTVDSINQIGEVKIVFSERLKSILDFDQFDLDSISSPEMFDVNFTTTSKSR